ncbi:MAG: pilus assembly protein PilM [Verrucomicrobia bacterium]|jgi:type IV pilus assembly protein PilM|nr:pilus assembly protein PilM [Verrucomicrobiota bacterium]
MALPFFDNSSKKKRDQMLAIDLGGRTTKAVHLQRRGDGYVLGRYALLDAPIYEKNLSVELLGEHLKAVSQALEARTKFVTLALGCDESIVRHAEMPRMPAEDMRLVLKNNSRNYLQQDLSNHVFDCYIIPSAQLPKPADPGKPPAGPQKQKVLIAGAKKQVVDNLVAATRNAGLVADHILPGLIGPINAFKLAAPEVFSGEIVALVDLGFKHSSISIMAGGELILSRTVAIGGDRLTAGLAESMNISYPEAEGIKVGMAHEVQAALESLLSPLGRELRASIDFFEHQQDRPVSQVFITGGSARSEFIMQSLQNEMMVECKTWNPTTFLRLELPPAQAAEIEQVAPQLTVAIGAALTAF